MNQVTEKRPTTVKTEEAEPGRTCPPVGLLILTLCCFGALISTASGVPWQDGDGQPSEKRPSADHRTDLLPVPVPNLTSLDPSVSSQITATAEALDRALNDPGSGVVELAEAFGTMGEIYQAYQLPASAEACYLNALNLAGKRFRWVYLLARVKEGQGRLDDALAGYQSALSLEAKNLTALVHLGNVHLQLGNLDDSRRRFQEALEENSDCAAAHAGIGQVALKLRDFPAAVSALKCALELAPGANRLHYLLAMAYRGLGDQEAGKAHLQQSGSVGVRVDDPIEKELENLLKGERVRLVRGRLAYMAGRYQESIREFREALAVAPDNCRARINLAGALASAGSSDEALSEYQAAAGSCSDSPTLHFNLGRLYLEKGQPAKALEHYQISLRLDPADLAALLAVAGILAQGGSTDQAAKHLEKAASLHPDSEEAWYQLCSLLLTGGQFAEARDRLEKACQRLPGEGRLTELLARLLAACPDLSLRDGARALDLAQRVYAAAPTVYHGETLALALAETGRCEEAAAVLKESVPILQESQRYPELLARIRSDLQRYEQGKPCRPPQ
jgi:tetratricopeptide (TPR) repeat protein